LDFGWDDCGLFNLQNTTWQEAEINWHVYANSNYAYETRSLWLIGLHEPERRRRTKRRVTESLVSTEEEWQEEKKDAGGRRGLVAYTDTESGCVARGFGGFGGDGVAQSVSSL
jgi:hypothetical protein